jgi:hypothetical protein
VRLPWDRAGSNHYAFQDLHCPQLAERHDTIDVGRPASQLRRPAGELAELHQVVAELQEVAAYRLSATRSAEWRNALR